MPYCTDCGFDVPPGTRFCPSCGSDQLTVLPYEVKGTQSIVPLILGISGIILGIIVPIIGLVLGGLGAALAYIDKGKRNNIYLSVCIIAIIVSLAAWVLNFVFLMGL